MNPPDALSATVSDRTIAYTEQAFTFAVGADRLVGILHAPRATTAAAPMQRQVARAAGTGVVVIVGGPQYRVGSHRQFVRLARHLALLGHPVLRFDARGMGDSSGALHSFEHTSDDIAAAIDELMTRQPQVRRVVLWGLCDGAAAALLYLHGRADPRVQALCLLNPWVRSEASLARTQIKHYYGQRLLQRAFWLKLLSGQVAGAALRGLWTSLRAASAGLGRDAAAEPFPVRMAQAWQRFGGDILLVLSGKDYTAREFQDVVAAHPAWKGALDRPNVQLLAPEAADHTFSDRAQSRQLELAIGDWLTSCAKAADHVACRPADRPTLPQPPMPDRPNLVTSLRLSCLEIGVFATLTNALDRALRAVSGGRARLVSYALVAQPIGHLTSAPLRPSASSRIVEVGPSDPLVQSMPRPKGVLDRRFAARFECLCATVRGEFAGMLWIAREQYDEDEVRCLYVLHEPARSVWDFDVYVAPAHRASRTLGRLWQAADLRLGEQGVQWSFSRIALTNAASLAAHKRLGARRVGTAFFWVIGSLQIAAMSQTPFIHVGFTAGQRPRLKLRLPAAQTKLRRPAAPVDDRFVAQAIGKTAPAALVLGLDSHGLAVARALSRAGVAVYAVERDLQNPGVRTRYVKRVFPVADYTAEHLMPALALARRALAMHGKVALLAINDRQVEVIAQHLPALRADYCIAWVDQAESILRLQRKDQLEAVSVKQGLNYPKSVVFEQPEWPADAPALRYPVILKPVRPLSSFKTLLIDEPADLIPALQRQAHDLPILAQEYIPGGDAAIYFGALLLDRGRVVHAMAGRKIASYPPARGQTTIAETVDAPEVVQLTQQFFDGFALSGPVSLELKLDTEGRFWVIEPTIGRTDFWAELCISAGFNQPLMEFELAVGLPLTDPGPLRGSVWYDTERDIAAYAGLCWREAHLRPHGKSQVFTYLRHRDWRPLAGAVARLIRHWARQLTPGVRNPLPEFVASKPHQPPSK